MYSLTFRVRYAVMYVPIANTRGAVVITTKPVHRLQIRPIVHN